MNRSASHLFVIPGRLFVLLGLCLCCAACSPDYSVEGDPPTEGYFDTERQVNFPDLGEGVWVRVRERESEEILDWDTIARAKGTITVPPGHDLMVSYRSDERPDLRGIADVEPGYGIQELNLFSTTLRDRDLRVLEALPHLEALNVSSTEVGDRALEYLRFTPRLKRLEIKDTEITDDGLVALEGLSELESLRFGYNDITDAGLERLAAVPRLKQLWLSYCPVGDKALEQVGGLSELEALVLSGTQITSDGLRHLAGLEKLEVLYLQFSDVDDAGLPNLASLVNLKTLDLSGTWVKGEGLRHLAQLTKLERLCLNGLELNVAVSTEALLQMRGLTSLDLTGTGFGEDNVNRLRRVMAGVEIHWTAPEEEGP